MTDNLVQRELPRRIEEVSHVIIGRAIEVHRELGPGLLERIYEDALLYELREAGLAVAQQVEIEVTYKGATLSSQRLDLIVEGEIIPELKAIAQLTDLHKAQLLSYLRMSRLPLGLLLNFNVRLMRDGIARVFNERALASSIPQALPSSSSSSPSRSSRS